MIASSVYTLEILQLVIFIWKEDLRMIEKREKDRIELEGKKKKITYTL
jgi:hypothetical protein